METPHGQQIEKPDDCDECGETLKPSEDNWTPEGECLCDMCWSDYAEDYF